MLRSCRISSRSELKGSRIAGGCRDVSQVIDYIAAYLFPNGERVIDEYIATGVSMGGEFQLCVGLNLSLTRRRERHLEAAS